MVFVETVAKVIIEGDDTAHEMRMKGIAIPISKTQVVALTHCLIPPEYQYVMTMFGPMAFRQKVLSFEHFIDGKKVNLRGYKGDVALLEWEGDKVFPAKLGDSDKVKIGTKVMVFGWSLGVCQNFKDGMISNVNLDDTYGGDSEFCFLHSVPTNPGDSGSPMIAYVDGQIVIIGIVNAMIRDNGLGFAIKSNYIKECIYEIENSY